MARYSLLRFSVNLKPMWRGMLSDGAHILVFKYKHYNKIFGRDEVDL